MKTTLHLPGPPVASRAHDVDWGSAIRLAAAFSAVAAAAAVALHLVAHVPAVVLVAAVVAVGAALSWHAAGIRLAACADEERHDGAPAR